MAKKKDARNAALTQAEKMIEAATGTAFGELEAMTSAQRQRLTNVGTQALYFSTIAKALEAIRAIDIDSIHPNSRPVAAGILVDKVERLARLLGQTQEEGVDVTRKGVEDLLGSVQDRVRSIAAAGVRIELGPDAVKTSYRPPGPTEGAVIEAPTQEGPPAPTVPDPDAWPSDVEPISSPDGPNSTLPD